jgi:hypothetical protein
MRVACDIGYVDLDGDYTTVEGVRATCSRCGYETESFGTSDASIRRCLAVMREECPNGERNYYLQADARSSRQSPIAAAYKRGYQDGHAAATRQQRTHAGGQFDADQLRALVTLCHPDRHPRERFEVANAVTARLLEMLKHERKAA